ncbi:MAG: hypothetical protein KDD50_07755 [Bdellovibrionales bacterium]|nr:hypothetical protein [Bdellovibrionales bacterium]
MIKNIHYDPWDKRAHSLVVSIPDLDIFLSFDALEIENRKDFSLALAEKIAEAFAIADKLIDKKVETLPSPSRIREVIEPKNPSPTPSKIKKDYQIQLLAFLEKAQKIAKEAPKKEKMPDEWISTSKAAKVLGVDRKTICRAVDLDKIKSKKTPGGHRKVLLSSVLELSKNN